MFNIYMISNNNQDLLDDAGNGVIPSRFFRLLVLSIIESTLGTIMIIWASAKVIVYVMNNHTMSVVTIILAGIFLSILSTPFISYYFRFRKFKNNLRSEEHTSELQSH